MGTLSNEGILTNIAANLKRVEARIAVACARVGRARSEVTLVAVSKTRPAAEIIAAYHCGLRHFGENRVEEMEEKTPPLRAEFAANPAIWHLIGHVQSRKAKRAVDLADIVQSVDSLHLAERLNRCAAERSARLPVLLECNVSGEEAKYGFAAWDDSVWAETRTQIQQFSRLDHLEVRGLMTMAPIVAQPEEARPVFRRLRQLRDILRQAAPFSVWAELSMGMTDDFEVAIEEGATLVRIGRAIFGPRT